MRAAGRGLAEVEPVDVRDPKGSRDRILEALRREVDADFAIFYTVADDGGVLRYADLTLVGVDPGSELGRRAYGRDGKAFDSGPSWHPHNPPAREVNRIVPLASRMTPEVKSSPAYRSLYRAAGIRDQLRMLVYSGDELVGWVGALRYEDRPAFSARELRRLRPHASKLVALLRSTREGLRLGQDGRATLLLRADGGVDYASRDAERFLDLIGRDALASFAARGARGPAAGIAGPIAWDVVPMEGVQSTRCLLTLRPLPFARMSPLARLSGRRRQVAEYAAAGATAPEIARALGTSVETVRTQLKAVYRELDVGSRAELACVVAEAPLDT